MTGQPDSDSRPNLQSRTQVILRGGRQAHTHPVLLRGLTHMEPSGLGELAHMLISASWSLDPRREKQSMDLAGMEQGWERRWSSTGTQN